MKAEGEPSRSPSSRRRWMRPTAYRRASLTDRLAAGRDHRRRSSLFWIGGMRMRTFSVLVAVFAGVLWVPSARADSVTGGVVELACYIAPPQNRHSPCH